MSKTGWISSSMRKAATVMGAALAASLLVFAVLAGAAAADTPAPTGVKVTVVLQAHDGSVLSIPANGSASYYSGGWHQITSPNPNNPAMVQTELAPGTYAFAVVYNGTRDQKTVTIGSNGGTVYFHAALVNVELQAHDNSILDIPANGSATYYAGGWRQITTTNVNNPRIVQTEMLPGTYSFAATYNGTRDQKQYTVIEPNPNNGTNATQTVYFHAALVTGELLSHSGQPLADGTASYYAGGWHAMADNQAEMLPGTYSFAMVYNGTRNQKQYTVIEPNPNNGANAEQTVSFQTTLVNVQTTDSALLPNYSIVLGSPSYYAGGWHEMTIVNPNNHLMREAEMLPGTYSFADVYNGARQQTQATIGTGNAGHIQSVYFGF
jgi:hypothetical protein